MASFNFLLLFFTSLYLFHLYHAHKLLLPLTKNNVTLQYLTKINYSNNPIDLVIDLSGPFIWLDCHSKLHGSHSIKPISSHSLHCSRTTTTMLQQNHGHKICNLFIQNRITGSVSSGQLVEGTLQIRSHDGAVKKFDLLVACAPTHSLDGLASGANGMLGLGRSRISLPSQLGSIDFGTKFTVCFSSSNGALLFGDVKSNLQLSRSLIYTPLVVSNTKYSHGEYVINVKSIKISNKRLPLEEKIIGGAKISTIVPYTTIESTIYANFIRCYKEAAIAMNLTIVGSVSPFGLCFSSKDVKRTKLGLVVPEIDLVLQSELVKWRFRGRQSMVEVNDGVMCLGFLDGGLMDPKSSIVIGGFQLEDSALEFDFGTNMLGFSSSTSCSDFLSGSAVLQGL